MLLRTWRLLAIMLTALSMSAAMAHLLEMPAKLKIDGPLWLTLLKEIYPPAFGTAGAAFEVGAVLSVVVLAFLVRQRKPAFGWTLFAAVCLVATHAIFWIFVEPVNSAMLPLRPETLPANWTNLRNQWEYSHAARAVLQIVALGALALSIIVETPSNAALSLREMDLEEESSRGSS